MFVLNRWVGVYNNPHPHLPHTHRRSQMQLHKCALLHLTTPSSRHRQADQWMDQRTDHWTDRWTESISKCRVSATNKTLFIIFLRSFIHFEHETRIDIRLPITQFTRVERLHSNRFKCLFSNNGALTSFISVTHENDAEKKE